MGKTNLLDAIYYLAVGKSYANIPDAYLVKKGTDFFRLEGLFELNGRQEQIVAKVVPRAKKELERNKVPYQKISEHVGLIPIVFIAPDDVQIVKEGSEVRRKFIDNTLSQLDRVYLKQLIEYNKLLKQRNALLKQFAENNTFNAGLLRVYNEQMNEPAQYIFEQRNRFVNSFHPVLMRVAASLSSENDLVNCKYQSPLEGRNFEQLLIDTEEKDRYLQRTTTGIHKDDLIFSIDDFSLKKFASQGQLKTFILSLKLAQYEFLKAQTNNLPLLLLDDIFDKLDESRVANLLEILKTDQFGQVFITDTHNNRITQILEGFGADFSKYFIHQGTASQEFDSI